MMTFLCQNQSLQKNKLISANIISERSTCCHEYHVKMSIIVIEHCLMLISSGVLQPPCRCCVSRWLPCSLPTLGTRGNAEGLQDSQSHDHITFSSKNKEIIGKKQHQARVIKTLNVEYNQKASLCRSPTIPITCVQWGNFLLCVGQNKTRERQDSFEHSRATEGPMVTSDCATQSLPMS